MKEWPWLERCKSSPVKKSAIYSFCNFYAKKIVEILTLNVEEDQCDQIGLLFFYIWACKTIKSCPKTIQFCQSRLKICQTLIKPSTIWQRFIKCCKVAKFRQIWSHWRRLCSVLKLFVFGDWLPIWVNSHRLVPIICSVSHNLL